MKEAAKIGNITVFNAIFDDGIIDPNAVIGDTFGDAALHYAAYWGRIISHTIHISYTQQSYLMLAYIIQNINSGCNISYIFIDLGYQGSYLIQEK